MRMAKDSVDLSRAGSGLTCPLDICLDSHSFIARLASIICGLVAPYALKKGNKSARICPNPSQSALSAKLACQKGRFIV